MTEKMMKVVKYDEYGPPSVLRMSELPIPTPDPKELLIKIASTTVTSGDVRMRSSDFPPLYYIPGRLVLGLFRPKKQVLGHEFAGTVVACGDEVKNFQAGDRVYGTTSGLTIGSYAEFIAVPQEKKSCVLAKIPKNISFAKAAATSIGAMAALDLLFKGNIEGAKQVMVIGACGSVGSFALQITQIYGASVTAVCSKGKLKTAKKLGANQVIDYQSQSLASAGLSYDLIFDSTGKYKKAELLPLLSKGGRIASTKSLTAEKNEYLQQLSEWLKLEKISPLIDCVFSFDKIPEAHTYVEKGHKSGAVVISISDEEVERWSEQK